VGLTGGIGAGKSAVATRLAGLGALVIDADRIAREVVEPGTDGLREIVAAFGEQMLGADGELDRSTVGAVVFGDDAARRRLEAIIHPRVRARTAELVSRAPADAIVVNDVPLLVEAGLAPTYHLVIVVEAAQAVRVARLVRHRQMTPEQALARIRAQADDARRRAAADVTLVNDGDLDDLYRAVDALWHDRLVPYERNLRERRRVRRPEALVVREYDPTWPEQAARLAARLGHAVGDLRIDHIGSTAIPGLPAKDVIDLQLVVPDLADGDALRATIEAAGFPRAGDAKQDVPWPADDDPRRWRKYLHGGADPGRLVHLHVRARESPGWRKALLFRDFARADAAVREEYAALKRQLVAPGLTSTEYAAAKEPWFAKVWPRAQRWAASTGWRP